MKSLVAFLNQKSSAELRLIADTWQANLTDRLYTGNSFQLAQEMQSEFLQRRLVEQMDPVLTGWLEFFIDQPEFSITQAELDRLKPDYADQEANLKKLKQAGLLYEEKTIVTEGAGAPGRAEIPPVKAVKPGWSEIYGWRNRDKVAGSLKTIITSLTAPRELARPLGRLLAEKKASLEPPTGQPALKPAQVTLFHLVSMLET
jgi:hypothetical protein